MNKSKLQQIILWIVAALGTQLSVYVNYIKVGGLLATGNIKAEDAHGGGVENESNHSQ